VNKDTVFSKNLINIIKQEIIAVKALLTADYNNIEVKFLSFNSLVERVADFIITK